MARKTAAQPSDHSVSVDHDLLIAAQKAGGHKTFVDTVHAGLRLVAGGGQAAQPAAAPATPAARAKLFTKMTGDNKTATSLFLTKARQALRDALAYFVGEEAMANTATKKRLRIEIADLEADLKKMNARILAILAGQLTMPPPSQATVDKIGALAEEVGQLTLKAQSADQIVTAAKSVVDIWTGALA